MKKCLDHKNEKPKKWRENMYKGKMATKNCEKTEMEKCWTKQQKKKNEEKNSRD